MTHNTLKQQAKAFAKEHGLPYAKALHAVDEPLHLLRDVTRLENNNGHFRIISDPDRPESNRFGENRVINDMEHLDVMKMLLRNQEIITQAGARDVWHYRELSRAGLVSENIEVSLVDPDDARLFKAVVMFSDNMEVGVYAIGSSVDLKAIPITQDDLDDLMSGGSLYNPKQFWVKPGIYRGRIWETYDRRLILDTKGGDYRGWLSRRRDLPDVSDIQISYTSGDMLLVNGGDYRRPWEFSVHSDESPNSLITSIDYFTERFANGRYVQLDADVEAVVHQLRVFDDRDTWALDAFSVNNLVYMRKMYDASGRAISLVTKSQGNKHYGKMEFAGEPYHPSTNPFVGAHVTHPKQGQKWFDYHGDGSEESLRAFVKEAYETEF